MDPCIRREDKTTHDPRSTINDQRFIPSRAQAIHDSRSTINDQRSTINDSRSTIHDQRFTIPDHHPLLPRIIFFDHHVMKVSALKNVLHSPSLLFAYFYCNKSVI